MRLRDALLISALTATATYFLTFFVNASYRQVTMEPWSFLFETFKVWMSAFWGNFIVLFGLEEYVKRRSD